MLQIPVDIYFLIVFVVILSATARTIEDNAALGTCPYNRHEIFKRQAEPGAFAESLYEAADPILQLGVSNFDTEVFNKNSKQSKAHLVEFYLSWCGHCRHFAPFYVKFADDVKNWRSVAEVTAINCALDYNRDLCDSNRVEMVPYIRYYGRNAKEYDDAVVGTAHRSSGQLRRQLVDFILRDYEQHHYVDWPSFQFLPNASNTTEVWNEMPKEAKYLILIFERPNVDNYTAVETILDILPHYPHVVVRRVKDDHPLATQWDIVDLPSLAILDRREETPIYLAEIRRMIVGDILGKLALGPSFIDPNSSRPIIVSPPTTRAPHPQSTTPETAETRRAKYYVSETDLLLATRYALTTEVPYVAKNIAGANFTKLVRFVDVLKKYFPKSRDVKEVLKFLNLPSGDELPRSDRARRFFADLSDFLASVNSSKQSISGNEWKAKITELEARHDNPFPKNSNWQHCRGSKWKYRGYTCGLWSLFHTLTVNAYLEDGLKTGFDPFDVLRTIKGYVETYFGCTYCSRHFVEMVTVNLKMEDLVKFSSDVVMYLWRAHNTVNKRLAGDTTEDPVFPKRQFPPDFLCDECQQNNQEKDTPDWAYRDVLRFLLKYYTGIKPHTEVSVTTTPPSLGNTTKAQ